MAWFSINIADASVSVKYLKYYVDIICKYLNPIISYNYRTEENPLTISLSQPKTRKKD